jgi:hypothetical protein
VPDNKGFWIENKFGSRHIAFSARHRFGILPELAVRLGFGISYLSSMARWVESENKITEIWLIPTSQAQRDLERFLRKIRKVKSLEIRNSQAPLDYTHITQLKNLRHLSIQGKIVKDIDLSELSRLVSLSGSNSSICHLNGLEKLKHLSSVQSYDVKSGWVKSLPIGLKSLTLYGKFPVNLDISKFSQLNRLNFARSRQIDFTSLNSPSNFVKILGIRDIKAIKGIEFIPILFPKLREIRASELEYQLVEDLKVLGHIKCTVVSNSEGSW